MGINNSKRPRHIENKLFENDTDNVLNHLHIIKEFSNNYKLDNFFQISNPLERNLPHLENSTQKTLYEFTNTILKENAEKSEEGLYYGEKNLREVFTPIKVLAKATYSMSTVVGYKGSKPYAVLKFGGLDENTFENENILHEIAVGLVLNRLRDKTPGFMYTYGGFYSSPPVKIREYFKLKNEFYNRSEEIAKMFLIPSVIEDDINTRREKYDYDDEGKQIERELDSYESPLDVPDYFINYFMFHKHKFTIKFLITNNKQTFQEHLSIIEPLIKQLLESKYFRMKEPNNIETLNTMKELLRTKLDFYKSVTNDQLEEYINHVNQTFQPKFEPEFFCNSDEDKTTMILLEFINNSITHDNFIKRFGVSEEDKVKVRIQIILSMFIAFRKFKFLHFDLHGGNILIRMYNKPQDVKYLVPLYNKDKGEFDIKQVIIKCKFVPQIIDFGDTYLEYYNISLHPFNRNKRRQEQYNDITLLSIIGGDYKEIKETHPLRKLVSELNNNFIEYNTLSKEGLDPSQEEKLKSDFKRSQAPFNLDNFIRDMIDIIN